MKRVPKVAREIFLAHCVHCCSKFFPDQPCYIMKNIFIYEGVKIVYDYHYYQTIMSMIL
jgi:hypothetical protein